MSLVPSGILNQGAIKPESFASVASQVANIQRPSEQFGIEQRVFKLKKLEDAILKPKEYYENRRKRIEQIGKSINTDFQKDFESVLFERDSNGDLVVDNSGNAMIARPVSSAKRIAETLANQN